MTAMTPATDMPALRAQALAPLERYYAALEADLQTTVKQLTGAAMTDCLPSSEGVRAVLMLDQQHATRAAMPDGRLRPAPPRWASMVSIDRIARPGGAQAEWFNEKLDALEDKVDEFYALRRTLDFLSEN